MTRETAKRLLPLIQAFSEGSEIEARNGSGTAWQPVKDPIWADGSEYRIKPGPRTLWLNVYTTAGTYDFAVHQTEALAKAHAKANAETIQVIEVIQ